MAEAKTTRVRKTPAAKRLAVVDGNVVPVRPAIGKAATAVERRLKAIELRKAGATYQVIGDQLGVTRQAAHKMVKELLEEWGSTTREEAENIRALELERLDRMQMGLWNSAIAGDAKAVETVLKVMDRRARYLGLDIPVAATPEGTGMFEVSVRYVEAFRTD